MKLQKITDKNIIFCLENGKRKFVNLTLLNFEPLTWYFFGLQENGKIFISKSYLTLETITGCGMTDNKGKFINQEQFRKFTYATVD